MKLQPEVFFSVLANATRLRCLWLLEQQGRLCVCELTHALDAPQPLVSRHLARLRAAGIVLDSREGLWIHYRINPELPAWAHQVLRCTTHASCGTDAFHADRARLLSWASRPSRKAEGESPAVATILFTDIAGFTAITERLGSHWLVAALNEYFSLLVEVIERHRGVVTQFQGDAMLVVYNVPVEDPMHAAEAVATAIEIQACLKGRRFAGDVRFETRIGINTGTVLAGAVGAKERLNYTVHGDAVNVAARLQELNKGYHTRILVADATRRLAGAGFAFRRVDEAAIRGHAAPVEVYTVESGDPDP